MPEYLTPGVYIEEIEIGAKPIEGVSTSTAAFLGKTERGPIEPRLVTSFDQFRKLYGGYLSDSYLAYEIDAFFRNGGSRCYIARIVGESSSPAKIAANTATKAFPADDKVIRAMAVNPGEEGNKISVQVDDPSDSGNNDPEEFRLTVYSSDDDKNGKPYTLSADPQKGNYYAKANALGTDHVVNLSHLYPGRPKNIVKTPLKGGAAPVGAKAATFDLAPAKDTDGAITVRATAAGEAGNKISVQVDDPKVDDSSNSGNKDPEEFILTIYSSDNDKIGKPYTLSGDPQKANYYKNTTALKESSLALVPKDIDKPTGRPKKIGKTPLKGGAAPVDAKAATFDLDIDEQKKALILSVSALGPGGSGKNIKINIQNAGLDCLDKELFKLTVFYKDIEEVFDNLSIKSSSSDYYLNRVNGISNLVTIKPGNLLLRPGNIESKLEGGNDGEVGSQDYEGYIIDDSTGMRTGWLALDRISDISIYCEPFEKNSILQSALTNSVIAHCETMRDRFAILQTSQEATSDVTAIMPCVDSKYAALYHPWVQILDPITNLPRNVPPCGHIAGIYARTDGDRGVHKAPANVNVNGAIGLKFDIKKGEQDILNPRGVNCIRAFQGQGIKVWGARTISHDPLWKYINVRRLFIFLEKSIEQGTQWVVFEPNNEALWSKVKQTISQFLTTVWRSGALMGATEEEAFFVKCDRTTMTQDDIDNGRLIVVVGVAPVKPAEFVIFRIAQVANASSVSE